MTDDLIAFLRARLDEDERKVAAMESEERRVQTAPIFQGHPPRWLAGVDIFVSSKRWRAEVEAKRRMLSFWPDPSGQWSGEQATAARAVKERMRRLLALPYADHPDYRAEWRP